MKLSVLRLTCKRFRLSEMFSFLFALNTCFYGVPKGSKVVFLLKHDTGITNKSKMNLFFYKRISEILHFHFFIPWIQIGFGQNPNLTWNVHCTVHFVEIRGNGILSILKLYDHFNLTEIITYLWLLITFVECMSPPLLLDGKFMHRYKVRIIMIPHYIRHALLVYIHVC